MAAVVRWWIERLIHEYPHHFSFDGNRLHCNITGDVVATDFRSEPHAKVFDALACQVSEDVCVIRADRDRDWLAAAHVCSPGHWAVEDKIGRSFAEVHSPVAGIEPINRHAGQFVHTMIHRGPFVRFAWGVSTDDRLNHHPAPPPGINTLEWAGSQFDSDNPQLFVRVERQVMWGLPAVNAAVFTIRVFYLNGLEIRKDALLRGALASAIRSMSAESRTYKGLAENFDSIIRWLGNASDL